MRRITLDANVLAPGATSQSGASVQILNAWHAGEFELVLSDHLLQEVARVGAGDGANNPDAAAVAAAFTRGGTSCAVYSVFPPLDAIERARVRQRNPHIGSQGQRAERRFNRRLPSFTHA